jgi:hypothetical protein
MILDAYTRVASAQAITDADEVSASSIDLGNPTIKNRVGSGERLSAVFTITTAAAGDSASATDTCDLIVVEDTAATLASKTVIITRRVAAALLTAGSQFEVPLPSGTPTKRYLGGQVALGTGDTLSATIDIIPSEFVPSFLAYAKGYAV